MKIELNDQSSTVNHHKSPVHLEVDGKNIKIEGSGFSIKLSANELMRVIELLMGNR